MTAKEACKILTTKYPKLDILDGYEFESVFTFTTKPKNMTLKKDSIPLDYMFAIDKKTSIVTTFQPFHIPVEEYRNGKQIHDFK